MKKMKNKSGSVSVKLYMSMDKTIFLSKKTLTIMFS